MKNTFKIALIALFGFISFQISAQNPTFSIQSTLKNITGEAISDGEQTITFKLYTQEEGGTSLWTETADVDVVSGIYSHELGSVTPLSSNDFGNQLYLGVTVLGKELSPRTKLGYAPYALAVSSIASYGESAGFDSMGNFVVTGPISASNISDDITVNGTITATDFQLTNKPVVFANVVDTVEIVPDTGTNITSFSDLSDSLYVSLGDVITVDLDFTFEYIHNNIQGTSYILVADVEVFGGQGCEGQIIGSPIWQNEYTSYIPNFPVRKHISGTMVFEANCTGAYSFSSILGLENINGSNFRIFSRSLIARRN